MEHITIDMGEIQKKQQKIQKVYIPRCWVCMDRGYLLFNRKFGKREYEHIAHCICDTGRGYTFYGPNVKEHPSEFYVPSIEEIVDTDTMARENIQEFINKYRDNPDVMSELKKRGVA